MPLSAQNLKFAYTPEKLILNDVSLEIQNGEIGRASCRERV